MLRYNHYKPKCVKCQQQNNPSPQKYSRTSNSGHFYRQGPLLGCAVSFTTNMGKRVAAIQRFTTNMGKRLGLKVSGRYWDVAAIQRFTTNMGKRLGLKVWWPLSGCGRYSEVAALRGSTVYQIMIEVCK